MSLGSSLTLSINFI